MVRRNSCSIIIIDYDDLWVFPKCIISNSNQAKFALHDPLKILIEQARDILDWGELHSVARVHTTAVYQERRDDSIYAGRSRSRGQPRELRYISRPGMSSVSAARSFIECSAVAPRDAPRRATLSCSFCFYTKSSPTIRAIDSRDARLLPTSTTAQLIMLHALVYGMFID